MGNFDGLEKAFSAMMWLSVVGLLALFGGGCWGLWWLFTHVSVVVK